MFRRTIHTSVTMVFLSHHLNILVVFLYVWKNYLNFSYHWYDFDSIISCINSTFYCFWSILKVAFPMIDLPLSYKCWSQLNPKANAFTGFIKTNFQVILIMPTYHGMILWELSVDYSKYVIHFLPLQLLLLTAKAYHMTSNGIISWAVGVVKGSGLNHTCLLMSFPGKWFIHKD